MTGSMTHFYYDEDMLSPATCTDVHQVNQFVEFVHKMVKKHEVVINFPMVNWKFDNESVDNFLHAIEAIKNVHGKTPIIVHVPEMNNGEVIKSNTVVFYQMSNRVFELTPEEALNAYTYTSDGDVIPPPKRYNFVTVAHFFVTH